MRRYQQWLLMSGVMLLVVAALAYALIWHELSSPGRYPIKRVVITGEYHYLDQQQIQKILTPFVKQGLFALSETKVEQAIASISAVASVSVWRIWPDQLRVVIHERHAIARWGPKQLLSDDGVIFTADTTAETQNLPLLVGDPAQQALMVHILTALTSLFALDHLTITGLMLAANQDISVEINHQFWLNLGNQDLSTRVSRFLEAYPVLLKQNPTQTIKRVDLRYPYGMAVAWQ